MIASLPIKIIHEEPECIYEQRLIALFINSKTTPVHKIGELVKAIKEDAYSKGFRDGSRVKSL